MLFSSGNPGLIFLIVLPVLVVVGLVVYSGFKARRQVMEEIDDAAHLHEPHPEDRL